MVLFVQECQTPTSELLTVTYCNNVTVMEHVNDLFQALMSSLSGTVNCYRLAVLYHFMYYPSRLRQQHLTHNILKDESGLPFTHLTLDRLSLSYPSSSLSCRSLFSCCCAVLAVSLSPPSSLTSTRTFTKFMVTLYTKHNGNVTVTLII